MNGPAVVGLLAVLVTPPAEARFGIAGFSDDHVCLALPGGPVEGGTDVTLVVPEKPQKLFRARIQGPRASCERLERANVSGPYYDLEGLPADAGRVPLAIAILGSTQAVLAGGVATITLAGTKELVTVRSCTSQEGVHLTAWAGKPPDGRRLWHAYWYLGYDVEASCTVGETK
jgi:hypothetical protein